MKILGIGCYGITMPNTIQPQDYSNVFEGWWHRKHSIQFATFNLWNDERNVNVNRNDNDWNDIDNPPKSRYYFSRTPTTQPHTKKGG